jgi:hypothetical protein
MADKEIGSLTVASAADGTEQLHVLQGANSRRITLDNALAFRTITSGNGLTGGGTLDADLTLAVGAGIGISVAADAVAVDINGLSADATPDNAADYVMTYDASAATLKKVLLSLLVPNYAGALVKLNADLTGQNYTTAAAITWDGADVEDTDDFHDPASSNTRITIPVGMDGRYRLSALVTVAGHSGAWTEIEIRKNGAYTLGLGEQFIPPAASTVKASMTSYPLECVAGDYFEVFLLNATDTSVSVLAAESFFSIEKVIGL